MESVPKKFWDKTFNNYIGLSKDTKLALNISKKYAKANAWNTGSNLIILGSYGTGKTHLAASIVRYAISKGQNAVLVTAPSLASGSIDDIRERFRHIPNIDLIAIDDFSNESEHKMVAREIFDLLNYRYEAERGIVLTSNLTPKDLRESLGDRVFDRVLERTLILHIKDIGSYRKTKREKYLEWVEDE
jgi:DNA replication protein DnaC